AMSQQTMLRLPSTALQNSMAIRNDNPRDKPEQLSQPVIVEKNRHWAVTGRGIKKSGPQPGGSGPGKCIHAATGVFVGHAHAARGKIMAAIEDVRRKREWDRRISRKNGISAE